MCDITPLMKLDVLAKRRKQVCYSSVLKNEPLSTLRLQMDERMASTFFWITVRVSCTDIAGCWEDDTTHSNLKDYIQIVAGV